MASRHKVVGGGRRRNAAGLRFKDDDCCCGEGEPIPDCDTFYAIYEGTDPIVEAHVVIPDLELAGTSTCGCDSQRSATMPGPAVRSGTAVVWALVECEPGISIYIRCNGGGTSWVIGVGMGTYFGGAPGSTRGYYASWDHTTTELVLGREYELNLNFLALGGCAGDKIYPTATVTFQYEV